MKGYGGWTWTTDGIYPHCGPEISCVPYVGAALPPHIVCTVCIASVCDAAHLFLGLDFKKVVSEGTEGASGI